MRTEWAFLGGENDSVFLGLGPFKKQASCPLGETAFYQNSFDLSSPTPWIIPDRVLEIPTTELATYLGTSDDTSSSWEKPLPPDFSQIFQEISRDISSGSLKKSVPVVTEKTRAKVSAFSGLASRLFPLHENLTPYGYFSEGAGFIGASPETLFQSYEGKLKTMALAGTARAEERDIFAFDEKEIQEHEFVAETLLETLTPLGMTRRHERRILSLGALIHFHTAIDVELYQSHSPDDLISHLHPTPALGPLPRNAETMSQLVNWRNLLGCPSSFGAPFGFYHEGRLRIYVSIRMMAYEKDHLLLPAGCGVIEASRLTNEWRELELKRESVKKLFHL